MSQTDKFDTKELRSFHAWNERIPEENLELFREAADHIDAQAAEIERLREALVVVRMSFAWSLLQKETQDVVNAALSGEPT